MARRWTYDAFVAEKLNLRYISEASVAEETLARMLSFAPEHVAVDFETTQWDVRLVQLGVDLPGYRPQQLVFDCHRVPFELFVPIFEERSIEKLVHFSQFEQGWVAKGLGTVMTPVFDTCIAWQSIQTGLGKHLKSGGQAKVDQYLPGWEKHPNKLTTLSDRVLGFPLPKDEQASDWGRPRLTKAQIVYAALDVAVLPEIALRTRPLLSKLRHDQVVARRCHETGERARTRHA